MDEIDFRKENKDNYKPNYENKLVTLIYFTSFVDLWVH